MLSIAMTAPAITATAGASINLPTVLLSGAVALVVALIASFTQRWSVKRTLKAEDERHRKTTQAVRVAALQAYAGCLWDAAAYAWDVVEYGHAAGKFPEDLDQLRNAARPHFAHIEASDREAFVRMSRPGSQADTPEDQALELQRAREDVLEVIAAIEAETHGQAVRLWPRRLRTPADSVRTTAP